MTQDMEGTYSKQPDLNISLTIAVSDPQSGAAQLR